MLDSLSVRHPQRLLDYFRSLSDLGRELNSTDQIGRTLASTLSAMADVFDLRRVLLLAAQDSCERLVPIAAKDLDLASLPPIPWPPALADHPSAGLPQPARRPPPKELARWLFGWSNGHFAPESAGLVPLLSAQELVGLFLFDRMPDCPPLDPAHGDLLASMCQNLAVYFHNQIVLERLVRKHREAEALYDRAKETYRETIMAFLTAIDIKDGYTKEHSLRVAECAALVARELGFTEHEIEGVYFAGLLHDIGKILVDKQILTKPGSLDLTEYAEMSDHTRMGAEILSHLDFPWENLVHTILHHHDRPPCDATPPPRQRCTLDLSTRIIGLTDAFDAMTSDRPYRRALSLAECFHELVDGLGEQFDPEMALTLLKILDRELDRPPGQRRILTRRLVNGHASALRRLLNAALRQIEQFMGTGTAER